MAIEVEVGASSWRSSNRFVSISTASMAMPAMFPPGRCRFATRPSSIGSAPTLKMRGMVEVASFAATPDRYDHCNAAADKVGRQCRQSIILAIGPAVFHRHILVLDITDFLQALMNRGNIAGVRR